MEVEIIGQKNQDKIEIYVMGKPKYEGFQEEIQKTIVSTVIKCYGENVRQIIQIKLNYGAFNPNFVPENNAALNSQESSPSIRKKEFESKEKDNEYDYERLSNNYQAAEPKFSFEQVILPRMGTSCNYSRSNIRSQLLWTSGNWKNDDSRSNSP